MTARNEHTGKVMTTGAASEAYRTGHEGINWSIKREPSCFGAYLGGNIQAERSCEDCPHHSGCYDASR